MADPAFDGLACGVVELDPTEAGLVQGGAVAPLVAVLMIPLVSTLSFAFDMGYIATTSRSAQSASDAAALAGTVLVVSSYVAVSGAGNRR